jgi:hypothetical protein
MCRKRDVFEFSFSLSDLENMLPYETSIYFILIQQKLLEHDEKSGK